MSQNDEIKIRVLPRGDERPQAKKKPEPAKKMPRWIIYVGSVSAFSLLVLLFQGPRQTKAAAGQTDMSSLSKKINDSVTRHMQDVGIERDLMARTREMENKPFEHALKTASEDDVASMPDTSDYGVVLDTDDSEERVYQDLQASNQPPPDVAVGDKINAKLADRQWTNQMERQERINFIGNFIRSAYERGYELDIDQNLVVVGVHRIDRTKKVNINQVIDRLAKQGL